MSAATIQPGAAGQHLVVDLAPITESVSRSMNGQVAAGEIERLLHALLAGDEFATARVVTYVPILLHRAACDRLRSARRTAADH